MSFSRLSDQEVETLQALTRHRSLMFFDVLITKGCVQKWPSGYEITPEGRTALAKALRERELNVRARHCTDDELLQACVERGLIEGS